MSQVKNLRAMFEQKNDSSSPENGVGTDRGRSPAGSTTGRTDTPTPRPLSKVRSNFIAVEKDGRVGLRRDPSNDSARSQSQGRLSSNTEEGSVSNHSEKPNITAETIPESPRQFESKRPAHTASDANSTNGTTHDAAAPSSASGHDAPKLGAVTDKPSLNPDKRVDVETPTPKLLPASPADKAPSKPLAPIGDSGTNVAKATRPSKTAPRSASKQPAKFQTTATKPPGRNATIPSKTATQPTSAAHAARATREPVKKSTEKPAATSKTTTTAAGARNTTRSATPASTTTTGKKATPAPVQVSPGSSPGFVKPKVKSPTRPVNLPSSLMAPTASSSSKVREGGRESLPGHGPGLPRSLSRASVSTAATSTTNKTLRRQRSTIIPPRPSVGPPPKKPAVDHPVTHKEKEVDESFLARMMRPTQSSTSKVTDKVPVTPPRRGTSRKTPGSARGTASASASGKKEAAKSGQPATGSPVPKSSRPADDAPKATGSTKTTEREAVESVGTEADVKGATEAVQSLSLGDDNKQDKPDAKDTSDSTVGSEQATVASAEQSETPVVETAPVKEPEMAKDAATEADVAESATAEEAQDTSKPEQDGDDKKSSAAASADEPSEAGSTQVVEETTASGEGKVGPVDEICEETIPAAQQGETGTLATEGGATEGDATVQTNVPAEETSKVGREAG